MDEQQSISLKLAALLLQHRDELICTWVEHVGRRLPASLQSSHYIPLRRERAAANLNALYDILSSGSLSESGKRELQGGIKRVAQWGADIPDIVDIALTFKEAVLPLIRQRCDQDLATFEAMVATLDDALRLTTCHSVRLLRDELAGQLLQEQEKKSILEERQRLSHELHDGLAQTLDLLKLQSALAARFHAAGQAEHVETLLHEMHDIADRASVDAREAIFNLRSIEPNEVELVPTIHRYLSRYRAAFGLEPAVDVHEEVTVALRPQARLQVLRILEEALSNVRKHAGVNAVRVTILSQADVLRLGVEDEGRGFAPAEMGVPGARGAGLSVMRERAESIGGRLQVESEPGRGTRVTLWVPQLREAEEDHGAAAHPAGR